MSNKLTILFLFFSHFSWTQNATVIYKPGININYSTAFINNDGLFTNYTGPYTVYAWDSDIQQSIVHSLSVNSTHSIFINEWLVNIDVGVRYNSSARNIVLENVDSTSRYSLDLSENYLDAHVGASVNRMFNLKKRDSFFSIGVGTELSSLFYLLGNPEGAIFSSEGPADYTMQVTAITTKNVVQVNPFVGFDFILPLGKYHLKTGLSYYFFPPARYYALMDIVDQYGNISRLTYESNRKAGHLKFGLTFLFGGIKKS